MSGRKFGGSSSVTADSPLSPSTATPAASFSEDTVYVAVGRDVKESEYTIAWALHHSGGRRLCVLHVHTPAKRFPPMGIELEGYQARSYREKERQDTTKILDKYLLICSRAGAQAGMLLVEMDSVKNGIVDLISKHGIRKLVMGAAANKCYSKRMTEIKSNTAIYVCEHAPSFCQIWFICKGNLIYTRESKPVRVIAEVVSPPIGTSSDVDSVHPSSLTPPRKCFTEGQDNQVDVTRSFPEFQRVQSDSIIKRHSEYPSTTSTGRMLLPSSSNVIGRSDCWDGVASQFSSSSPGDICEVSSPASIARCKAGDTSPATAVECVGDELNGLEKYMIEAEKIRKEAFEQSKKRMKAEKEALEARRRANASGTMYAEEFRRRSASEDALARRKDEVEQMKREIARVRGDLQAAQEQKSSMESQIANSDKTVHELEQKMFSAVELLQKFRKERDILEVKRDNALREVEYVKEKLEKEASKSSTAQFFAEFSFSEIRDATSHFDPNLKISEDGYGTIYRGLIRHTPVAIKILNPSSSQCLSEFQQEVDILSKLRHPNLVTLIGACPESFTLVYEYLPNGSLEDRINCKGNTPPLSWQTRIRIATELCSALIFLHSCTGQGIVHSNLTPANVLLDFNFVSKLSNFGTCLVLSQDEHIWRADQKGSYVYMDPEFLATGELTLESDVYSFGIILLRLLTGKPALGITKEVQCSLDEGTLEDILDPTAGDWPFVQAKQLAHLAMSCCEMNRGQRADLASEAWKVLEPMRRASCRVSSFQLPSYERCHVPHYFLCPIFQVSTFKSSADVREAGVYDANPQPFLNPTMGFQAGLASVECRQGKIRKCLCHQQKWWHQTHQHSINEIMEDPVVAADGFTYEAEALRGWLDSGQNMSPMTNHNLSHTNFVPNRALRSAIQEWLHLH